MSDALLKQLEKLAIAAPKPIVKKAGPIEKFKVDVIAQKARAQSAKDDADFKANNADWFRRTPDGFQYTVKFGKTPLEVFTGRTHYAANDLSHVLEILDLGHKLAETNPEFQEKLIAAAEARKKKPEDMPAEKPKRTRKAKSK